MSLPTRVLSDILKRGRGMFRTALKGLPMGERRFLGMFSRGISLQVWGAQKSIEDVDKDIVPSPLSSSDSLTAFAVLIGLPDGAGGYGRLKPSAASGGAASLTGVLGTIYPTNRQAVADDGSTIVKVASGVSIPGSGSGSGSIAASISAVTTGSVGNLPIGTVCTWSSAPAGSDPTFTLTTALAGGQDIETDAALLARIIARLQTPPRGGTAEDHRIWAETIATIAGVWVYPRRSGTGTVDVVLTIGGSGQNRVAGVAVVALVQAAVDALRPVAVEAVNVYAAYAPNGSGHLVRVRVAPLGPANVFDWVDTGGPFTVDLYTPGPPATLRLNTLAPASLKAAIDSYIANPTGALKPRLQVLSTGAPAINPLIGCVNRSDSGGKTTLTLDTVTAAWPTPTIGDTVYAGGPVVATIAAAELALCDSLGPSRASGMGDALTPWLDTLSVNKIAGVAEDATDANGALLISEALAGGVTIDGGSNDVQGGDATVNPPELLYLSHIAVTQ